MKIIMKRPIYLGEQYPLIIKVTRLRQVPAPQCKMGSAAGDQGRSKDFVHHTNGGNYFSPKYL